MKQTAFFIFLLLFMFNLSGYTYYTENTTSHLLHANHQEMDNTRDPLFPHLSNHEAIPRNQAFVTTLKDSIAHTKKITNELDLIISETQHTDELDHAIENMDTAKREILYEWNKIHNESYPNDINDKQVKTKYENILMEYNKGLAVQIDSMKRGDARGVMKGLEITKKAKNELNQLSSTLK